MEQGLDYLGIAKFPRVALRNIPNGACVGAFAKTFGDSRGFISEALAKGAPRARVHLLWNSHVFGEKQIHEAVAEAKKWKNLSDKFKDRLLISPWCEHYCADKRMLERLRVAIIKELPHCVYVNNPSGKGAFMDGVVNEVHHSTSVPKGKYIFSFDGVDCCEADIQKFRDIHAGCEIFFLWTSRFNGKWEADEQTAIAKRSGFPDDDMCRSICAQLKKKEKVSLPSREVYKSHAENDGDGAIRAEKMVFISKAQARTADMFYNGKLVEKFTASGRLDDGRYVYRSLKWGFKTAQKYPVLEVRINGKVIGTFDPVFRQNDYKNTERK